MSDKKCGWCGKKYTEPIWGAFFCPSCILKKEKEGEERKGADTYIIPNKPPVKNQGIHRMNQSWSFAIASSMESQLINSSKKNKTIK